MSDTIEQQHGPFAVVPLALITSGLKPGPIALYALMAAKWANRDHECWPSRATIAGELHVSEDTVDRWVDQLVDSGWLTVTHTVRPDGGKGANRYKLRISAGSPMGTDAEGVVGTDAARTIPNKNHTQERAHRNPATTIPLPFVVGDEDVEWVESMAPGWDWDLATESFVDYWARGEGQGKTKRAWRTCWRNWMRAEWQRLSPAQRAAISRPAPVRAHL